MQIGSGVTTGSIRNLYTQGAVAKTGVQSDLAISGDGFFIVKDPMSGAEFATRAGDFRRDDAGYLVTTGGQRLQGYSDADRTTMGDIKIDLTGMPAEADPNATLSSWAIDPEGKISIRLSDGKEFVRGQVLLQTFRDPQALTKEGSTLYSGMLAAGPLGDGPTAPSAAPGTNGLGKIQSGSLELSNVDLANEFSGMITAQRAYQATARVISTSDELLQELVNLKR